jgi:hypothetical protein
LQIDWLFIVSRSTKEFFTYIEKSPLLEKGKFRLMLGAHGQWAGRDLYRATPALTRGLDFSGLIRGSSPFSRLLRHTRRCGESDRDSNTWSRIIQMGEGHYFVIVTTIHPSNWNATCSIPMKTRVRIDAQGRFVQFFNRFERTVVKMKHLKEFLKELGFTISI